MGIGNNALESELYQLPTVIYQIQAAIEAIEKDTALYEETNFDRRVEAVDSIEFHIIDRLEGLLQTSYPPEELLFLKQKAAQVKRQLEVVDESLFRRLRADIRAGASRGAGFKALIEAYVGREASSLRPLDEPGYDNLDLFINGLLLSRPVPAETKAREPEMVYYQQTPTRIIFELVKKAQLTEGDVFYDLGSGLGQVPILVNLLSGAAAKGIEFEPAYNNYASRCAADLNLSQVSFIQADARTADYSDGTVFFMYTPFEGSMLQEVLARLRSEAQKRRISLFTYGPCTPQVAQQSWLKGATGDNLYKLEEFRSLL